MNISDLDLKDIAFSKSKVKTQNKFSYIYYNSEPLVVKFPKLRLPFGVSKDTLSNKTQYILDVSLEKQEQIVAKLREFDDYIINKVKNEILVDKSLDELREMYVPCLKISTGNYPPTFRSKITTDTKTNDIKCQFYYSEKNVDGEYPKVDLVSEGGESWILSTMNKNSYSETVAECFVLWIMNGKFGVSWRTIQVKVFNDTPPTEDVCEFLDSSDSEIDFV